MLSEYITSLADVSFHIVAYMYAVSVFGKKSYAVCGFLAYFCAVLRFSDPPYAPLDNFSTCGIHQWWILTRVKNREGVDSEGNIALPFLCVFFFPSPPLFAPATRADLNKV